VRQSGSAAVRQRLSRGALLLILVPAGSVSAQSRAVVEQERRDFAAWMQSAPLSPRRAVGVFPIGSGLSFGPARAQVPLAGVAAGELSEREGRIRLKQGGRERPLTRGRAEPLGGWYLVPSGTAGRTIVTVFGRQLRAGKPPSWFPYDSSLVLRVTLTRAAAPASQRVLAPDGTEVEATEAGTVSFSLGGKSQSLRVLRLPGAQEEESELEIYFRDPSNDRGTYPAGRFVSLIPEPGGGYLLDFNRARNPFCAYNTAYPCPAPWRGNTLVVSVQAGERYQGGGLTPPPGS
jgi:hypothetical protein